MLSLWRIIAILLVLLVVGVSYSAEKPNSNTAESKKFPPAELRGSDTNPLTVKLLPESGAQSQAAQNEEYRQEKAILDRWLTYATMVLAVFTALLWWSTYRMAKRQGYEMKQSLSIAEESIKLAHEEFTATHRPRLVVRRISPIEEHGATIGLHYTIHNVGATECTVVALSEFVWLPEKEDKLPPIPLHAAPVVKSITLECGSWVTIEHTPSRESLEEINFRTGFGQSVGDTSNRSSPSNIVFMGYIDYVDGRGRKRQTAFLRQFDFKTNCFNPTNDPEYEYQD